MIMRTLQAETHGSPDILLTLFAHRDKKPQKQIRASAPCFVSVLLYLIPSASFTT